MNTENLIINDDRKRQEIKHIRKNLPHLGRMILPHTLGVKAITLRNATRLVVPSHEMHAIRIPEFQTCQEGDGLDAKVASVDVIPQEEVIRFGDRASNPENFQQVVELPFNRQPHFFFFFFFF
jgi:hypothetical protein